MSDQEFILFPRGLQFLNQAEQYVMFGKVRQLDAKTHFIPMYWKGPIDNEVKPKYRKIVFETDRISCLNVFYQDDNDWVIETDFVKQNDRDLLYFIQSLEDYIIEKIADNSLDWFRYRITRSQVESGFRPLVIVSRRSHQPIVRWHVSCENGTPSIELINQFRRKMYPHQLHPGMDIDIRFHLAGIQFNETYCTPVIHVTSVRVFSSRSGNVNKTERPFKIIAPIIPPTYPVLPNESQNEVRNDIDESEDDEEEIIIDSNGKDYVLEVVEKSLDKLEVEPTEDVELVQEVKPIEEEVKPVEEIKLEEEEVKSVEEVDLKPVEEVMIVEETRISDEVKPVEEIKVGEENERKERKVKKSKIVKKIFKTSKGERVWKMKVFDEEN